MAEGFEQGFALALLEMMISLTFRVLQNRRQGVEISVRLEAWLLRDEAELALVDFLT